MSAELQKKHIYTGKRLFTIPQTSTYLGMSTRAVRELVWDGALPYIQRVDGGKIYIDVRDLDAFIDREKRSVRFDIS